MLSRVKTKFVQNADKVIKNPTVQKAERMLMRSLPVMVAALVCVLIVSSNCVLAEGTDAKGLLKTVLSIMGAICTIMAVGIGGMGIMHFATAQADGDGPAKQKAIQQISAAVILVAVGGMLLTNPDMLTKYIQLGDLEKGVAKE